MSDPKKIVLWESGSPHHGDDPARCPQLTVFLPRSPEACTGLRGAVIVCPGGAYRGLADHEGEPFAQWFAARGLVGFVLTYRVAPHRFPAAYTDAARAVRLVRQQASSWRIDPARVALMGFSAGGHLASAVAVQPNLHHDEHDDLVGVQSARPDRLILGYPVISFTQFAHTGSMTNLLGAEPSQAQRRQLSNEQQVNAQTPPTFIFTTADDPSVPVENSLNFAAACRRAQVPVELHCFEHGAHGLGMAQNNSSLAIWMQLLENWLADWIAAS